MVVDYKKTSKVKNSVVVRAIKEALSSNVKRGRVGAVLFTRSGRIICSAHNSCFYGRVEDDIFTIHAEDYVIKKALKMKALIRFRKEGLTVLVVRFKPSSLTIVNSKPCGPCQSILDFAKVDVLYSNNDGEIVKL